MNTFFQARSFSKRNAYIAKYAHIHMYVTSIIWDRGIENRKDVHSAFLVGLEGKLRQQFLELTEFLSSH